jgi:lambda family phage portal protein
MGILDLFKRSAKSKRQSFRSFFSAAKIAESTSSWTTQPVSIDQKLYTDLRQMRARSREQSTNNAFAGRYLAMLVSNVIGPKGIRMSSLVTKPGPGGVREPDTFARENIETAWAKWGKSCDYRGYSHWVDFCAALLRTVSDDGESFVRIHSGGSGPSGIELEIVDAELVDVQMMGTNVIMGVEKDDRGRPVAYHLRGGNHAPVYGGYVGASADHVRVPASEMIHVFVPEYPGQTRGIPWGSGGLLNLRQLDGYIEAAVDAARFGAAKMGFITTEDGDFTGDDVDAQGNPVIDGGEPGWYRLNEGETVEAHDPTYPHEQFPEFVKAGLRRAASDWGVNYNLLANDYEGVSFSAMRHSINEDQEQWKARQEWFIRVFVEPVFDMWLERAILFGDIAGLQAARVDQYKAVGWTPRRWGYLDPLKDINAAVIAIENNLDTRSNTVRNRGMDPDDLWAEKATEEAKQSDLGIAVIPEGETEEMFDE